MTMEQIKVVIDAGHGGRDRWNKSPDGTYIEADAVLIMALACGKKLNHNGIKVIYTRETDVDLSPPDRSYSQYSDLNNRCVLANNAQASLFVSIHTDASANLMANGTTSYCYQLGGVGEKLANAIESRVVLALDTVAREVQEVAKLYQETMEKGLDVARVANFFVLKYTKMPAALIEVAFHTNDHDLRILKQPVKLIQAGEAIAQGILDTLGLEDKFRDISVYQANKMPVQVDSLPGVILDGISVNGTGYLPIREFCELKGMKYDYLSSEGVKIHDVDAQGEKKAETPSSTGISDGLLVRGDVDSE